MPRWGLPYERANHRNGLISICGENEHGKFDNRWKTSPGKRRHYVLNAARAAGSRSQPFAIIPS